MLQSAGLRAWMHRAPGMNYPNSDPLYGKSSRLASAGGQSSPKGSSSAELISASMASMSVGLNPTLAASSSSKSKCLQSNSKNRIKSNPSSFND